jgi:signal peptidase II
MARNARIAGFAAIVVGVLLDQAYKAWMLGPFELPQKGRVSVAPFLDLVMVWNRGVSYGLFTQDREGGRWLLIALGVIGALLFGWWMWQTRRPVGAVALGLIVAGAVSNAIDRLVYGAVADFFLFHIGSFEWYVFNLADVWIVSGVIGLMLLWLTERREIATEP